MIHSVIFAGIGFVVGAFTPAIGRKVKAFFVKESTAVEASAGAAVKKSL